MATSTQTAATSDFIKNLGRMYGMYTGGFLVFIVLLAVLEQVGVPNRILGYLFVFFTLAVYAGVTCFAYFLRDVRDFYLLAVVVGLVQGGVQSLSRSYLGRLVPEGK